MIWMEFWKHPNIVNVRAVDIFNGSLFIALEFVPPGELGDNCLTRESETPDFPADDSQMGNRIM